MRQDGDLQQLPDSTQPLPEDTLDVGEGEQQQDAEDAPEGEEDVSELDTVALLRTDSTDSPAPEEDTSTTETDDDDAEAQVSGRTTRNDTDTGV